MTRRIALATATAARDVDEDLPPLADELGRIGLEPVAAVWDDPDVRWETMDAVVVRSTWDYAARRGEFLAWAARVAGVTRLHNPEPVLAWNTDKRYLFDLAEAGLPVVPTRLLVPGDPVALGELDAGEIVVKPAVSAGAWDTDRYPRGRGPEAAAHVAALLAADRAVLVQPYEPSVDVRGERALVHLDGTYSHTIAKGPILRPGTAVVAGLYAEERIEPATPSDAERALADAVVELVARRFGTPLYARIDLVEGVDGPRILEVELTEPSLFHAHAPGSAARFAAAIAARVG
jgi:glutathione synthase/RimK-type ligase-like ATP-grasp enzyme